MYDKGEDSIFRSTDGEMTKNVLNDLILITISMIIFPVPTVTQILAPSDVPTSVTSDVPTSVTSDVPTSVTSDVPTSVTSDVPTSIPSISLIGISVNDNADRPVSDKKNVNPAYYGLIALLVIPFSFCLLIYFKVINPFSTAPPTTNGRASFTV